MLNSVDRTLAPAASWVFVTLTYHREDVTPRQCKQHLRNLKDRLYRSARGISFIWKLEPQKRGTPHLHLLLHQPVGIDPEKLREEVANGWHAIADPTSEAHLRMMEFRGWTQKAKRREFWQPLEAWSQVAAYAAKYCGKPIDECEGWGNPGRFWGVHNADGLPRSIIRARVSEAAAVWVGRQLRRYMQHLNTGRVDLIIHGKRTRMSDRLARDPSFVSNMRELAKHPDYAGRTKVKEYHYRPATNVRNRVGFVPAAVVSRLIEAAVVSHPLGEDERREVAMLEAAALCERPTSDAAAAARLHRSLRRIASTMFLRRREQEWADQHPTPTPPPPPLTGKQRTLWNEGES